MSGNTAHPGKEDRVDAEAAAWFARMRSDERTPEDEQRFRAWQEAAPEHDAAYAGYQRTFENMNAFADAPEIRAMREAAMRRPGPVFRSAAKAPRRAAAAALAACLMLGVFVFAGTPWTGTGPHGTQHETVMGERSTVTLGDGTLVTLTSNSLLIEEFSPERRRVKLVRGQAYFDVVSDAERPFVVEAGEGTVTALGTEFDVCRKIGGMVVTLIEGAVEVASPETPGPENAAVTLKAGEQVSFDAGRLSDVREVDVASAISWRNGLLLLQGEPFTEVVDEFNRHSRYKLLIDRQDPRFREILISGAISTDDPQGLVEYLKDKGYRVWPIPDSSGNIRLRFVPGSSR